MEKEVGVKTSSGQIWDGTGRTHLSTIKPGNLDNETEFGVLGQGLYLVEDNAIIIRPRFIRKEVQGLRKVSGPIMTCSQNHSVTG